MKNKFLSKIKSIVVLICLTFFINFQSNAQVEVKLNAPAALFGFFQTSLEFPSNNDFGFETEFIFYAIDGEVGGGALAHGKYYFNPDFGSDKVYIGVLAGGFAGDFDPFFGFGFEAGYKWIGKRNILCELGGGVGRTTIEDVSVLPYFRFMIGYRFPKKEK